MLESYQSCDQREYKCAQLTNLKTHKRIHSGELQFECNQCEYKCAQLIYLIVKFIM